MYKNLKEENKTLLTCLGNLRDYYSRYKKQEGEFAGEFLSIVRG